MYIDFSTLLCYSISIIHTKEGVNIVEQNNKREKIYDYIRAISCIFIIALHCSGALLNQSYGALWWIGNVFHSIVRIGLPMFVLLSGALILNGKDEPISTFYIKRFIKILIPLYLYSFLYLFIYEYNCSWTFFTPINIINGIQQITTSQVFYHFWFLYMILGIYLCAPYLKKMCKNLTDTECKNLFILLVVISIIKYFLPSFNINININNIPFLEWTLYFLFGYLLTKEVIIKNYKIIYALGIVSLIFCTICIRWFPNIKHIFDLSPTMIFESLALFMFFIRNKSKICVNKYINGLMFFVSKYSLEIYLIHALVLDKLAKHISIYSMPRIVWVTLMIILVTIVSSILSFIIHNLVVKHIENLITNLFTKLKRTP